MVWKQMDGTRTLVKITRYIAQTYEKDHSEIIKDIGDFLNRLLKKTSFHSKKEKLQMKPRALMKTPREIDIEITNACNLRYLA